MARSIAIAAVALLALAGCSQPVRTIEQTEPARATTQKPPQPTPTVDPNVEGYVEAVTGNSPEAILEGRKYAEAGSVADSYLRYLANVREAMLDAGMAGATTADLTPEAGGYSYCPIDAQCVRFDTFTTHGGKITDLHVDGKTPGPKLLVGNGSKVSAGGATFELLSAYRSTQANALYVALEVATTKAISVNATLAVYRSPGGKQRTAAEAYGPSDIGADSNTKLVIVIQGVEAGGTLTLDGCADPGCEQGYEVAIKVGS